MKRGWATPQHTYLCRPEDGAAMLRHDQSYMRERKIATEWERTPRETIGGDESQKYAERERIQYERVKWGDDEASFKESNGPEPSLASLYKHKHNVTCTNLLDKYW